MIKSVSEKHQIKSIENLAYQIWHEHYTPIIGKGQVDYMLTEFQSSKAITEQINNEVLYFLAELDNRPIGYMSVEIKEQELFLSKFYLLLNERGNGYARNMIKFIDQLSIEKNLNTISLTVNRNNTDSIKIYEQLGFVKYGTVITDIGNGFVMDDYKMIKRL
jgi:RimJ/RimL family protein N-acetyltransferase